MHYFIQECLFEAINLFIFVIYIHLNHKLSSLFVYLLSSSGLLVMEVEAVLESRKVFAGQSAAFAVTFTPSNYTEHHSADPLILLSGYAVVQGFFKLGDTISAEQFQETRKAGVVLGRKGFEYGQPAKTGNFLSDMIGGLKHLVVSSVDEDNDENDYPVFGTSQLLLFPQLHLGEGKKVFRFSINLPEVLPPTYRSRSLQIMYNLVIGFHRPMMNSQPLEIRLFLPFRVLSGYDIENSSYSPDDSAEDLVYDLRYPINAPPPVFTEDVQEKDDMQQFVDQLLHPENLGDISGAPLEPSYHLKLSFDIAKGKQPIATLLYSKPAVNIGDVIAAQIKLHRPCLHLSAFLELDEVISGEYATAGPNASNGNGASNSNAPESTSISTIYARQYQSAFGLQEIALYFPTLTSTTPKLNTEQLTASWSLRLEFVGLAGYALAETEDEDECLEAKGQVDYETFSCRIPVQILPPTSMGHTVAKTWRFDGN